MSQDEKKRLNQEGGRILREAGLVFEECKDYDWIKDDTEDEGFADYYLVKCWNDSKMINEADPSVYRKLVEIDSVLGTDASLQLCCCLSWTTRWNIIETIDFEQVDQYGEYERMRRNGWVGFAEVYLDRCKKESESEEKIDSQVYTKLVELDNRLGTTASEQLFACLDHTIRWNIIKVRIYLFYYICIPCKKLFMLLYYYAFTVVLKNI